MYYFSSNPFSPPIVSVIRTVADPNDSTLFRIMAGEYTQVVYRNVESLNYRGYAGRDEITGLGGNDNMQGYDGDDILTGMGGDDTLGGQNGTDLLDGGVDRRGEHPGRVGEGELEATEPEPQGHEALLGPVVQVALQPPALGVARLHDAAA